MLQLDTLTNIYLKPYPM